MGFVEVLKKRAKENIKTIVLPETEDMRTLEATDKILKEGVAKIVLIGNEETIKAKAAEGPGSGCGRGHVRSYHCRRSSWQYGRKTG